MARSDEFTTSRRRSSKKSTTSAPGDEVARSEAFECLIDGHHQVGRHLLGHAAPFEWKFHGTRRRTLGTVNFADVGHIV